MLVDAHSDDYFVAARFAEGLRAKLGRLLMRVLDRIYIVKVEDRVLRLFRGEAVTSIGNSVMG